MAGLTLTLTLFLSAAMPMPAAQAASMPGAAVATATTTVRVPAFQRRVLPNGVVLLTMPIREVPLTAFTAIVRGGALGDAAGKAGLASITAGLLEKGAGSRDAFAFADAVAGAGGSFGAGAGAESITIGGQFLSRDSELMIDLLAAALQRPRFEAAEFDSLRNRQIELIKASKDSDPQSLVGRYARAFLFGSHPYAMPVSGSERSLASLTREDVQAYYRDNFGADRLTLVFAGDIDSAALEKAVTRAFGGFRRAGTALQPLAAASRLTGRRVLLVDSPGSAQTYFWIGNVGVSKRYPDRAALDIVNTLYGGRFTSILNSELRIKSGLSYGATSGFTRGSQPGEFAISSFAQTENTQKAIDLALQTLVGLRTDGVSADMLQSARRYVVGQFPLRLETAASWAGTMAELEFFGLDRTYIEGYGPALEAVRLDDTRKVIAEAFPRAEDLNIVMIGDATKIRDAAKSYGPLTEMALAADDFRIVGANAQR